MAGRSTHRQKKQDKIWHSPNQGCPMISARAGTFSFWNWSSESPRLADAPEREEQLARRQLARRRHPGAAAARHKLPRCSPLSADGGFPAPSALLLPDAGALGSLAAPASGGPRAEERGYRAPSRDDRPA